MTASSCPCSSPRLWLLLLLLLLLPGGVHTHANKAHFIKTSGLSVEEITLPDEQAVHVLFWMEEPRRKVPKEDREKDTDDKTLASGRGCEEKEETEDKIIVLEGEKEEEKQEEDVMQGELDEGPLLQYREEVEVMKKKAPAEGGDQEDDSEKHRRLVQIETEEEEEHGDKEKENELKPREEEQDKSLAQGGKEERRVLPEDATISLTYFVSPFSYPTLNFTVPQRDVWFTAHFHYDSVYIPVAGISRNPVPPSWWGRRLRVSSGTSVYWHLCTTSEVCNPGSPLPLTVDASEYSISVQGLLRVMVAALSAACRALLPVCLGLLATLVTLKRWRSSPHQHFPQQCSCSTHRNQYSSGL